MAGSRAREQRPDRVDGLSAAANHAADIALSELKSESGCSAARNFREHHVVGICDQLPNDELEKFSHDENANHKSALAQWRGYGATGGYESTESFRNAHASRPDR
jgi:hypothetical protein